MFFLAILPDEEVTQRFLWLEHPLETQKLRPIIESALEDYYSCFYHAGVMMLTRTLNPTFTSEE